MEFSVIRAEVCPQRCGAHPTSRAAGLQPEPRLRRLSAFPSHGGLRPPWGRNGSGGGVPMAVTVNLLIRFPVMAPSFLRRGSWA